MGEIYNLTQEIIQFRTDRNWKYLHTPRNLAIALSVEASELLELYTWQEVQPDETAINDEVADIMIYLINFCDVLGIDLLDVVKQKLVKNAVKYPAKEP